MDNDNKMNENISIRSGKVKRAITEKVQVAGIKAVLLDWSVTDRAEIFGRGVEEKRPYILLFQGQDAKTLLERANNYGIYYTHDGIRAIAYGIKYWGNSQEIKNLDFNDVNVEKLRDVQGSVQEVYYRQEPKLEVVRVENPHREGFLWSQLSDDALTLNFEQFVKLKRPLEMQLEIRQVYTPVLG